MCETIFLAAFTLHNIEEAIWLPAWSAHAGKFHPEVEKNGFRFAVLTITAIGYLLTFAYLTGGNANGTVTYLYYGFVLMMSLNAVFPHLLATISTRRYSPGTVTGCLLNLPIGMYLLFVEKRQTVADAGLLTGFAVVTVLTVVSLKPLFRIGKRLTDRN